MATSPSAVRADLEVITNEAQADLRAVAGRAGKDPATARSALFAATPLIVREYAEGAAALALDWYEEIRGALSLPNFTPTPLVLVDDEQIAATVAVSTEALYEIEQDLRDDLDEAFAEAMAKLEAEVQKDVASGFRDTIEDNTERDPEAIGWSRHTRPGACKFCRMLARDSVVYRTERSARFAAHTTCHCVARPEFADGTHGPEADVMQYLASQRKRTEKERKELREYLNRKYPDAPG